MRQIGRSEQGALQQIVASLVVDKFDHFILYEIFFIWYYIYRDFHPFFCVTTVINYNSSICHSSYDFLPGCLSHGAIIAFMNFLWSLIQFLNLLFHR